ncbi:IS1096 element passenger TnpR family protein [Lutibacter sp.]
MGYRIRIILDVKKDVIRDLIVDKTINLEELHFTIAKAFGFKGQEMASFYQTNTNWEQGEEIPLFDMSENGNSIAMDSFLVSDLLKNVGDKLIYVYDFMAMWTFFVELSEIIETSEEGLPKIALSFGNVPDEAPEKEFKSEKISDDLDAFDDGNDLENIDDFDFENY